MSFKVYNGVRFKTNNLYELKNQLFSIKEKCAKVANEHLTIDDIYLLISLSLRKPVEKCTSVEVWKQMCEDIEQRKSYSPFFYFTVCVYPYEDGTLYGTIFADGLNEFKEAIKDICDEFGFWTNTDKPEELSDEEWEHRSEVWHKIFDKCHSFKDAGFMYDIVTERDLSISRVNELFNNFKEKYIDKNDEGRITGNNKEKQEKE